MVKNIILIFWFLNVLISCKSQTLNCIEFNNKILVIDSLNLPQHIFKSYKAKGDNLSKGLNGELISDFSYRDNEIDIDVIKSIKLISHFDSLDLDWDKFRHKFLNNKKVFYFGNYKYNNTQFHLIMIEEKRNNSSNQSMFLVVESKSTQIDYIILAFASIDKNEENSILCTTKFDNGQFYFTHFTDKFNGICAKYKFDNMGRLVL